MKKSSDNFKKQAQQDYAHVNKAYRSTSSNSNLYSDNLSNFNSRSKKKGEEKAVFLSIDSSVNKNIPKDGMFKVHHYRNDYDPNLSIENSQIITKSKYQLIALDKYMFENSPNKKGKKVSIIGVNNENQQPQQITSHHRIKNTHPRPGQITATAVLTPEGYQQISSTDGEYATIDSSAPVLTNESNSNTERKSKSKIDSSFESSDIFGKKKSPSKSVQAEIESSFVDSNIGISPRNPHGIWNNNSQNETIEEIEYEYVTVDEEEEKNEEKTIKKREVSFDLKNINTTTINQKEEEEEIIEYEIIEEEEEEEVEFELQNDNQNENIYKEEEEEVEYEYVTVDEEEEIEDKLVPSNSLADVQPLNVFQKKQEHNNNPLQSKTQNTDYDDENDYATTEDNINTQSLMNSEPIDNKNEDNENEDNEKNENEDNDNENENNENEEEELLEKTLENENANGNGEITVKNVNENENINSNLVQSNNTEKSVSDHVNNQSSSKGDKDGEEKYIPNENLQQELPTYNSSHSQKSPKKQLKLSSKNAAELTSKSDNNLEVASKNDKLNLSGKREKKTRFANDNSNLNNSINVNDIQSSTMNQIDQKDSEPTISVFEEYVFADENKKRLEKEQKPKLAICDEKQNISKINDSSSGFNNSQIQPRNEKQISNALTNLVNNRNQILKSGIESTEININIVDDFDNRADQYNHNSSSTSPSKTIKKLYLSPSNAVESRAGNENSKSIRKKQSKISVEENVKNQSDSKSQFEFEDPKKPSNFEREEQLDKTNEPTIATCDLNMSNIQKSPPYTANQNRSIDQVQNNNSDEYYSHEYYTTLDTREQITNNNKNKKQVNKKNNDNRNSKKNNRKKEDDSYYSYSYYSDTYTYSEEPSTIETRHKRPSHHHRRHNPEYTYEYVTNTTYETIDREVRPVNNRNGNQLPKELQRQIQQQLQQQIQQNNNNNNQSSPYSIRLRVKDSQRPLFDLGNGQPPRFILRTYSEDGKATPHQIQLVLENSASPASSTASSPAHPREKRPENNVVRFEIPQIIESGPHKGMIKRRIKKSEKAKRDTERLMQVEADIKKMEQLIVEADERKQNLVDASVEITASTIDHNDNQNSPFNKKSPSPVRGRRVAARDTTRVATRDTARVATRDATRGAAARQKGRQAAPSASEKVATRDVKNEFSTPQKNSSAISASSRAISASSGASPNRRRYYDENGNPVLVEMSDSAGRPVFRRIVGKSSASSSVKQGKSNPNMRIGSQTLPRPVRGRNVASDNEMSSATRKKQLLLGTPNRSPPADDSFQFDEPIKKSPIKTAKIDHPKVNSKNENENENDTISDESESDSDDDEDFREFNKANADKQMVFGGIYRSRKAPHNKRAKFQNPQIYLRPRDGNSSSNSTPLKKPGLDSDSDSDSDELDEDNPFVETPKKMSPDTKRKKREEIEKEIEQLKKLLPEQDINDDNKGELEQFNSNKNFTKISVSIPKKNTPKRFVNADENEIENDPFDDYDANLKNLQRSPYDEERNFNINNFNNMNLRNREPPQLVVNPRQGQPSDGSAYSLTERRKIPKITVEIPSRGNDGQAEVFRRHYENASPEKSVRKGPERYRDFNEYDDDEESVPLNASTKNTFKNLDEENEDEKEKGNGSSNYSSKKRVRRRIKVSLHDGSRSPAPHSSNPLKDSQQQSSNPNSNSNSPSKKPREMIGDKIKPFIDNLKMNIIDSSSDDDEDNNEGDKKDDDPDSIGALNPVQAMQMEEKKKQKLREKKDAMPLTPPPDADLNTTSSMLSNVPPPSPKNQDSEIVYRNGKRKRKKKVPISPNGSHSSRSSKSSGTRGNVIRSHHLKDSQKYQKDSPPPSVLSSIINDDLEEEEENSTFIQDV